jgi:urease accessory protein
LLSWLSPTFPVGAFAYSHGLERAIHDDIVKDRSNLIDWLTGLLERGSAWNDAVLLAEAWRTAGPDGGEAVAELAEAMAGSRERHMETTLQGKAFTEAVEAWGPSLRNKGPAEGAIPYPVAIGLAAARGGIDLSSALAAYLHAFASNLIQAAVRLVPLGQSDGIATLAALEPVIISVSARAAVSSLDELGSCTILSDILSMKHETQYSRVFRT